MLAGWTVARGTRVARPGATKTTKARQRAGMGA
jgi:hypothetical protein